MSTTRSKPTPPADDQAAQHGTEAEQLAAAQLARDQAEAEAAAAAAQRAEAEQLAAALRARLVAEDEATRAELEGLAADLEEGRRARALLSARREQLRSGNAALLAALGETSPPTVAPALPPPAPARVAAPPAPPGAIVASEPDRAERAIQPGVREPLPAERGGAAAAVDTATHRTQAASPFGLRDTFGAILAVAVEPGTPGLRPEARANLPTVATAAPVPAPPTPDQVAARAGPAQEAIAADVPPAAPDAPPAAVQARAASPALVGDLVPVAAPGAPAPAINGDPLAVQIANGLDGVQSAIMGVLQLATTILPDGHALRAPVLEGGQQVRSLLAQLATRLRHA